MDNRTSLDLNVLELQTDYQIQWDSIERHTAPPYTLSLKSNGCIIFIAALTEEKLIFMSKHSLGNVGNALESHAQAGERWMRKHLAASGKTEEQLAKRLWEENWTAIAEVSLHGPLFYHG